MMLLDDSKHACDTYPSAAAPSRCQPVEPMDDTQNKLLILADSAWAFCLTVDAPSPASPLPISDYFPATAPPAARAPHQLPPTPVSLSASDTCPSVAVVVRPSLKRSRNDEEAQEACAVACTTTGECNHIQVESKRSRLSEVDFAQVVSQVKGVEMVTLSSSSL